MNYTFILPDSFFYQVLAPLRDYNNPPKFSLMHDIPDVSQIHKDICSSLLGFAFAFVTYIIFMAIDIK
jgi:hypothetical protein